VNDLWKTRKIYSLILLVVVGILLIITISYQNIDLNDINQQKIINKADVIMSSKVSRPGCETTNSCYVPSKITIKQRSSITWLNDDSAFHSVTSGFYGDPSDFFDSGYLDPHESFTFSFEEVGTYDYFCTLHPWMKGQVIVELD